MNLLAWVLDETHNYLILINMIVFENWQ
jgi:hypothetical protein